jgi:hypothetical protein
MMEPARRYYRALLDPLLSAGAGAADQQGVPPLGGEPPVG